ncbi:MAG: glucose-6-phosphate isomerase [Paracoccaceae bacterium]|jgi:glucose-6-phosphate isomerase
MTDTWQELRDSRSTTKARRILSLFEDSERFGNFSITDNDLLYDFSKVNIDRQSLDHLIGIAADMNVEQRRDAMFAGEAINSSEGRPVLHTALRANASPAIEVNGEDVLPEVTKTRARMAAFCDAVRGGSIIGATDQTFTDVVNIGIGGSDLGPAMAVRTLAPYCDGPKLHFVSNIDGADITDVLEALDPATTLIIIASKTFTTIETMTNAQTALAWLGDKLGDGASEHLAAVSSAGGKTSALGISPDRVFGFEDWVGGRYSMWGPVGLAIMMAIGPNRFDQMLEGARAADDHFTGAPLQANMPVLMALVGVWHRNVCGYASRAVIPYEQRLARLPAYLQQLDMESNGKSVSRDGDYLSEASAPIIWGEPGTNGQHAFFQALHQGTEIVPVEFLCGAQGHESNLAHQHDLLVANCLAQSEALMIGRNFQAAHKIAKKRGAKGNEADALARQLDFSGNRPSTTLMYPKLTPFVLGQLIATFEHRTFVEGVLWGVNSFDQWGVELGKELATALLPVVKSGQAGGKDASTAGLVAYVSKSRDS